jgi:methyl-accepting chemotaxis protein
MKKFLYSIKFKVALAFGICVALIIALGLFGIFGMARLNDRAAQAYTDGTEVLADFIEIRASQLDIPLQLRRIQVVKDPAQLQTSIAAIRADQDSFAKAWADYYPARVQDGSERTSAEAIKEQIPEFTSLTEEAIKAFQDGNFDAAAEPIGKLAKVDAILTNAIEQGATASKLHAGQLVDDGAATFHTARLVASVLVVAGVLIAVVVTVSLARAITRPLAIAIDVADKIANGRLSNTIRIGSRDEFGHLLEALRRMDQQLSSTVERIRQATDSVSVASKEIANGDLDLSSRTEEQAASLEETAASMNELTETVKQNADNARQANALATNAAELTGTGNSAVQGMVQTIGKISDSSVKISEITGLIEGIAFQTNILALNAAVEAARAGEHGRGFAVVAGEVRGLAQRAASAAKEIKDLIESSVAMIQDGAHQAADVGDTMGQVSQAIKQVANIVAEIATASNEQSKGIQQVDLAVNQMDQVTQQNAALVEQTAAAAQALDEQAMKLKGAVSVFVIGEATDERRAAAAPVQSKPRTITTSVRKTPARSVAKPQAAAHAHAAPALLRPALAAARTEPSLAPAESEQQDWETF